MASVMSARVCQLCGKPLSRIRVGTEGEFCSHKHRNQYRLRQGMDRLMEANKVANLMRRRELPKPIVPQQMESSTRLNHRLFSEPLAMPMPHGVILRQTQVGGSGQTTRLGNSRRAQISLVRFHVLGTGERRRESKIALHPSLALFLLPRSRRGGMRASDRPATPSRKLAASPQRGDMLRVSGNAGFRLRPVATRHIKPFLKTSRARPGMRPISGRAVDQSSDFRAGVEQWSALRTRLYVAKPAYSYYKTWSGVRPELREVSGSTTAAGAVPPGPVAARVAQVRIELQESMRYAILAGKRDEALEQLRRAIAANEASAEIYRAMGHI
jgi:hypothetical protein